jgi:hypothetical protein
LICDDLIEGLPGEHLIEQFWHVPADARWDSAEGLLHWRPGAYLGIPAGAEADFSATEFSESLYHSAPANKLRVAMRTQLPARLRTLVYC